MYQIKIDSPSWEIESVNGNGTTTYSSRNSGCAEFLSIPTILIPKSKSFLVKCDSAGRFVAVLNKYDTDLPYCG